MGSTTTHGLPYPVGTDRVMDGDNAIQSLAEAVDTQLYGATGLSPGGLGMWLPATGTVICRTTTLAAQPGTTITWARYMKIGRSVWFGGFGNTTTAVVSVAINTPNTLAGVPLNPTVSAGSLIVTGPGAPATQSGQAYMPNPKDRIQLVNPVGPAALDLPAGCSIAWTVVYESTT